MKKKSHSEESLLQFISGIYRGTYSGKQIKKAIDRGFCSVNGQVERYSSIRLRKGDEVDFREEGVLLSKEKPVAETLFEDEWLMAVHKPAGMDVLELASKGLLVHRLDKPTSGVLLIAKTEEVKKSLEELFREKKITKHYLGWVTGAFTSNKGTVEGEIVCEKEYRGHKFMRVGSGDGATTVWKVLKKRGEFTQLLLIPITGRTHQIRVHMASIGHPILGDYQYGKRSSQQSRLFLHAKKIVFEHPKTGKLLSIHASVPKELQ